MIGCEAAQWGIHIHSVISNYYYYCFQGSGFLPAQKMRSCCVGDMRLRCVVKRSTNAPGYTTNTNIPKPLTRTCSLKKTHTFFGAPQKHLCYLILFFSPVTDQRVHCHGNGLSLKVTFSVCTLPQRCHSVTELVYHPAEQKGHKEISQLTRWQIETGNLKTTDTRRRNTVKHVQA